MLWELSIKPSLLSPNGGVFSQSEGWERISAPPGHVISQGLAPGARVVTRGGSGSGGGGGGESLESIF